MNKFKKKLENFWYHYKTLTIIGLFAGVLLLLWGLQSCTDIFSSSSLLKANDIIIVIASNGDVIPFTDPKTINTMADEIAKYVEDFNKDKKTSVEANAIFRPQMPAGADLFSIDEIIKSKVPGLESSGGKLGWDIQADNAKRRSALTVMFSNFMYELGISDSVEQGLSVALSNDEAFIFIIDRSIMESMSVNGELEDLSVLFPNLNLEDETYGILIDDLPLNECATILGYVANEDGEDSEYYLAFRAYSEKQAKKQRYRTRYEQSKTVMEKILADLTKEQQ